MAGATRAADRSRGPANGLLPDSLPAGEGVRSPDAPLDVVFGQHELPLSRGHKFEARVEESVEELSFFVNNYRKYD